MYIIILFSEWLRLKNNIWIWLCLNFKIDIYDQIFKLNFLVKYYIKWNTLVFYLFVNLWQKKNNVTVLI